MSAAYLGSNDAKTRLLERLRSITVDQAKRGAIAWDGSAGSLVGALIEGDDYSQWEEKTGLPKWLAVLLDDICLDENDGVPIAFNLLSAIEPGTEVARVGNAFIALLLTAPPHGLTGAPLGDVGLIQLLEEIAALHARAAAGEDVAPATWKNIRTQAIALVDRLEAPEGTFQHALARCIEAATWDPTRSRSAVTDALLAWMGAQSARAVHDYGWTDADHHTVQATLNALHAKYIAPNPEGAPNVFTLLEEHHSELAKRLRDMNAHMRQQKGVSTDAVLAELARLLSEAPRATPDGS